MGILRAQKLTIRCPLAIPINVHLGARFLANTSACNTHNSVAISIPVCVSSSIQQERIEHCHSALSTRTHRHKSNKTNPIFFLLILNKIVKNCVNLSRSSSCAPPPLPLPLPLHLHLHRLLLLHLHLILVPVPVHVFSHLN